MNKYDKNHVSSRTPRTLQSRLVGCASKYQQAHTDNLVALLSAGTHNSILLPLVISCTLLTTTYTVCGYRPILKWAVLKLKISRLLLEFYVE